MSSVTFSLCTDVYRISFAGSLVVRASWNALVGASCSVLQEHLDLCWAVSRGPQAGRASSHLLGCLYCIVSRKVLVEDCG